MENRAHALVAGLFVIFFVGAVIAVALRFSGETVERNQYIVATDHSVTGLSAQAAVHYRGVNIGKVEHIYFDPENMQRILIDIVVNRNIGLKKSVYARLNYQGVTGLAYIQLDDDGIAVEPIKHDTRIPMRRSLLEEVAGSGQDLLSNVNKLTKKLNTLLDGKTQAQISNILGNIETGTEHFDGIASEVQPALSSLSGLTRETSGLVKHLNKLLTEVNQVVVSIHGQGGIIDNISQSIEEFSVTLPELREVGSGVARNSKNLDRVLSQFEKNPQSLLFGHPAPQPGPGEVGFVAPSETIAQ